MRADRSSCLAILMLTVLALPLLASEDDPLPSQATLPLEELLRLYRENQEAQERPDPDRPPLAATVHKLELHGRLLDRAVELTAQIEVVVLDDDEWVAVPLLRQDESVQISSLPTLPGGVLAVEDGFLHFLTRTKGRHELEISFIQRASTAGLRRQVRVEYADATLAACRLVFDGGVFRLRSPDAIPRPEDTLLFPRDNAFSIEWERTSELEVARRETGPPPAVEPVIPVAHASSVTTLAGERITRLRYQLRFGGSKPIEFAIPPGVEVRRAYLNGVGIPSQTEGARLPLQVAPAREGEEGGVLELVLASAGEDFLLSGELRLALPRVTWPVHQLYLDLHLPGVFHYVWVGGSLAPIEEAPTVHYTYEVPLPGRKLSLHQHLITSSSPDVTLQYAVDLEGHYFKP
jgi:hypothetical protein